MKFKLFAASAALFALCQIHAASAATVTTDSAAVAFGPQPLGTTSGPFDLTATANNLDLNASVAAWSVSLSGAQPSAFFFNPLPIAGNCAGGSLTCAISITFSPIILGPNTANLTFQFLEVNAAGSPLAKPSVIVPLSGDGIEATTPLPAALPLFATGLGALGLFGWRRRKAKPS